MFQFACKNRYQRDYELKNLLAKLLLMSEEQLKAFWEAVQADTSLQEKLRAATDADSIASIAKEAGFEITADEVKEAQGELTMEQLKGVAGGFLCYSLPDVGCGLSTAGKI